MDTIIRRNERSWAIEIISKINHIANNNDIAIKKAGGENTISIKRGNTMFPDVILYGNKEQNVLLQGWELKMPDVPIEDETFIQDAQRKARALKLNSFLIWNFTYAVLYIRNETTDTFEIKKQWSETSHIQTRQDVESYRADWEQLLEKIILEINSYFVSGQFRQSFLGDIISNSTIATLIERNKKIVADNLRTESFKDAVMVAYIDTWWTNIHSEYEHDETDKYNAYAKNILLNWANRVIFAHLIKSTQNGALIVNDIEDSTTPSDANNIFKTITKKCDFYNVFSSVKYNEILPALTWQDILELSIFLKENGIAFLDQVALQNILENSVNTVKREINGQYTTPPELARLLVRLTVRDWSSDFLDCCCGTATIPNKAIEIKKEMFGSKQAVETVWACDKYQFPLQVANISMANSDTIHLANRLFQHNALNLYIGEKITITDPEDGKDIELSIPAFGAVASNLPFVPFEIIPSDDMNEIPKINFIESLDSRSDLYCYIAVAIAKVLQKDGMLGIITSNSWLGTIAGKKFLETMKNIYSLEQVHISGKGRWFQNADVVTTIMIWRKNGESVSKRTYFYLWKKALEEFEANKSYEDCIVNSALLNQQLSDDIVSLSEYSQKSIDKLIELNISYNALFHNVNWLLNVIPNAVPIKSVFEVFRGSRRGWDALFYPKAGEHNIEKQFLSNVLINARHVNGLSAVADSDAFCCGLSIEELKAGNYTGAVTWINKFVNQKNGVGKPLPQVLARKGMQWYELQDNEIAEFFTMMNPDQRLFFSKFDTPSFVNQRLIGLKQTSTYKDEDLNHALLNSMFTMFYIEASGFGRGLGVLDINKESIANCYMLDPKKVSDNDRTKILSAFDKLLKRDVKKVSEELFEPDRIAFEHAVLSSFGVDQYFEHIRASLLSMQKTRATVKEKITPIPMHKEITYNYNEPELSYAAESVNYGKKK